MTNKDNFYTYEVVFERYSLKEKTLALAKKKSRELNAKNLPIGDYQGIKRTGKDKSVKWMEKSAQRN